MRFDARECLGWKSISCCHLASPLVVHLSQTYGPAHLLRVRVARPSSERPLRLLHRLAAGR